MTDHTEMQIPDDVMMYAEMLYDDAGCNYGDYKREELTKDYGQPRFDLMHDIASAIRGIQK